MLPVKDAELGFSLYVTIHNVGTGPLQIMTRPVQCCEVITPTLTDCKSIKMMGGYMGQLKPGLYLNASWTYPTLYEYNRRGECVVDLWWRDQLNRTDSKRFTIPFDTYIIHKIPWYMMGNYKKAYKLLNKRCESPDLDVMDGCQPVDCHMKYDGTKNYFSRTEKLCVASPTCYADPNKDLPDVAFSPNCNTCTDLETPIEDDDMAVLLRPAVNMDVFETMVKKSMPPHTSVRCHHGKLDPATGICDCEPGWSSAPVPEDFSAQRTLFTHMCTIYKEESLYDYIYQFARTTFVLFQEESFYLAEIGLILAAILVVVIYFVDVCLSKRHRHVGPHPEKDMCEEIDGDDAHFDSDGTEIVCTSSENWSEDVSDICLTESSSGPTSRHSPRHVSWERKDHVIDTAKWNKNAVQNVEVLYPAKPCLKRQSSSIVDSKSSSRGSASSSNDKQKMFETHFRLLVSLLLRRQPCTDAREHLDWIFRNCPSYQRKLVIRFMRSFGMDVDSSGNLRGFRPRGNILVGNIRTRSDGRNKHKMRICHLKPKRLRRAFQGRVEKRRSGEGPLRSLLKHSSDGSRGEPEGCSDIDKNVTIHPDYGDILKYVLPMCLEASPPPTPEVQQRQDSENGEDGLNLFECSPPSYTSSRLDISISEVTSILKKTSAMQCLALRHKNPSMSFGFPEYIKYLRNIERMRISYYKFIETIPRPISSPSSHESGLCTRKTAMDFVHQRITERVMRELASLEERYRGILSNKSQWELREKITGMIKKQSSEHIPLDEKRAFSKFFQNIVHFLFLMSCKKETMEKIMKTFGCSKHRKEMQFHPHACLFLCYLQPILHRFWKVVEVERLLLEYFVVEYPQHTCLSFLTNLKKTTKFRICLYLHLYKILAMTTRMEGVMEPFRKKFLFHIIVLERDLARFFKDMEKFQDVRRGVKPAHSLAGGLLSILEVLHYFMVQSLYKMCLIHADQANP